MRPAAGLILITTLACGALALVGIILSLLTALPVRETLFITAIGSTVLGALMLSGERKGVEELSKRAYITGGGIGMGDIRVWPRLRSKPLSEGEKLAAPSGLRSGERLEKAVPQWLTRATGGLAFLVAGVIMAVSLYLLGFG